MITELQDTPSNVAGFKATEEVTQEDYKNVMMPRIDKLARDQGSLTSCS